MQNINARWVQIPTTERILLFTGLPLPGGWQRSLGLHSPLVVQSSASGVQGGAWGGLGRVAAGQHGASLDEREG